MRAVSIIILVIVTAALAGGAGFWLGRNGLERKEEAAREHEGATEPAEKADEDVVASVQVEPLKVGTISQTVTAFGAIVAEPSDVQIQSIPFESRILHVQVMTGQNLTAESKTVELEASPDMLVALQESNNALDATTRDFQEAQQRFKDHLATNQELSQAQQALDAAKLKHQSLVDRGVGKSHILSAGIAGVVQKVDVQEGQIVPAGAPLVEIARGNRIEARLGVAEEIARALKVDQVVQLHSVDQSSTMLEGKIRLIGRRVDPTTRLAEVRVLLPANANLLLDSAVAGDVTLKSETGLIVPRNAALPDDEGHFAVFTVKEHRAHKHSIRLGLQSDDQVQVIADDLKQGDEVVVVGNAQLEDGMQVEVETNDHAAATTEPAKEDRS